jgi:hypothetical protein
MFIVGFVWAAKSLIREFTTRFPTSHITNAMGIIYLQYWFQQNAKKKFAWHLAFLKGNYEYEHKLGPISFAILSLSTLDIWASTFKCTMRSCAKTTMETPYEVNPFTQLWYKLCHNFNIGFMTKCAAQRPMRPRKFV